MLARLGEQSGVTAKKFLNCAPSRDAVEMGRAGERMTGGTEIVETKIVHDDQQDVGPGLGGDGRRGQEESGEGREPRTR